VPILRLPIGLLWYSITALDIWRLRASTWHGIRDVYAMRSSVSVPVISFIQNSKAEKGVVNYSIFTDVRAYAALRLRYITTIHNRSHTHTHTVVRECCKDYDESLWECQNLTSATPKPLTDRHENLHRWLSLGHPLPCKMFIFAHRNVYSAIFGVLNPKYSQDATTHVDEKCVKRRGFAQGCAFLGS